MTEEQKGIVELYAALLDEANKHDVKGLAAAQSAASIIQMYLGYGPAEETSFARFEGGGRKV